MSVLAWLAVPFLVTAMAFLFVRLRSRPERPVEAERGMQDLDRLRAAMSRPMPATKAEPEFVDIRTPITQTRPLSGRDGASAA